LFFFLFDKGWFDITSVVPLVDEMLPLLLSLSPDTMETFSTSKTVVWNRNIKVVNGNVFILFLAM